MRDHFETFCAHAAALQEGEGLPRFVEQEFVTSCGAAVWPAVTIHPATIADGFTDAFRAAAGA